jgi:hypothetical protein
VFFVRRFTQATRNQVISESSRSEVESAISKMPLVGIPLPLVHEFKLEKMANVNLGQFKSSISTNDFEMDGIHGDNESLCLY